MAAEHVIRRKTAEAVTSVAAVATVAFYVHTRSGSGAWKAEWTALMVRSQ
jgi:hypothetical protein